MKATHSTINNICYYFKRQWSFSKLSVLLLFCTIPISLAKSFLNVYLPQFAVNLSINHASVSYILRGMLIIGSVILIVNLLDYILERFRFPIMLKFRYGMIMEKVRKAYYTDYQNLENPSFRYLLGRADESLWGSGKGSLVEQMTSETVDLLTGILRYILFGTILSSINPWVAVILTITSLVNYFSIKHCQKYWYTNREEISKLDKKISYIVRNCATFDGAADIRIYGLSSWFVKMFKTLTRERIGWDKKYFWKTYIVNIIDGLLILFRDGFAYAILIYMVLTNQLAIDAFVLGFTAIGTFAETVGGIIGKVSGIYSTSLTTNDFRDYLSYPESENRSETVKEEQSKSSYDIQLKNLCFRYSGSEKDTLKNINLKIDAGEKIAIVGLNGAGKTTLVKVICGLYNPTSGSVLINGREKSEYNIYDYYSLFSTVFQDYHFLPVSVANVISSKSEQDTDRTRVEMSLRLSGLWEKISGLENGIDTMLNKQLNKDAVEFSGGELQKLILARAIYKDAPILVLDEPTAALDPIAEDKLYQSYNDLTNGKTSIFISHRLASTRFCDRIILIDDGEIVEEGTHIDLMNLNGQYAHIYKVQSEYYNCGGNDEESF